MLTGAFAVPKEGVPPDSPRGGSGPGRGRIPNILISESVDRRPLSGALMSLAGAPPPVATVTPLQLPKPLPPDAPLVDTQEDRNKRQKQALKKSWTDEAISRAPFWVKGKEWDGALLKWAEDRIKQANKDLKSGEQEKAKVKKGKGHLDALRKWEGDQSWDDGKDKAGKIVDQAAVDRLKSKLDDISSIAALLECAKTAGDRANVFDGTLSSRVDESAKSNASISDFFKNPECSAGAIVQPLGTKDKPGKIYVGPAFFDPEGKAGVLHGYDRDGRALMIMHECVHAFGNLTDDEFGGSSHLTEFLIDKCYPAKKGDMGNLVNHV
jgi:hypothetical protein